MKSVDRHSSQRSSLASRILDHFALQPTRDPIDPEQRRRRPISTPVGDFEVWIYDHAVAEQRDRMLAIKFPGAGGRAERGGPHPLECWPGFGGEVWIVNPPGYGGSTGRASLHHVTTVVRALWNDFCIEHPAARPLVIGNSIGCSAALYLASLYEVSGLMLRNPVPLRELILGRHSWWNFGTAARWLVRSIPDDLDPIDNARRCRSPALIVQSQCDTLVPTRYQDLIIDAYGGPKRVFVAAGINHHEPIPDGQKASYGDALSWLRAHLRD